MIEIIVDTRERNVIPFFNEYKNQTNISYSIQQVTTGDYSVLYNGHILFIIERKTWKDLAGSLRDGRKHNINKMIKMREETGCHLIYLIEGLPIPNSNAKFCRIPYKALRSHLDHLAFRDNIHLVYSKNQKNTVARIYELIQNYLTIKPSPLLKYDNNVDVNGGDGEKKLKEKIKVSPESIHYKLWCCFPYINETTASIFINQGYHISDLILGVITKEMLYTSKYINGGIIGSRSKKIWNGSRIKEENNKYFIKMLTQINGITKNTAEIIIDNISIQDLIKGNISLELLSDIKKTSNRKVGKKVASDVLVYFVKPQLNIDT